MDQIKRIQQMEEALNRSAEAVKALSEALEQYEAAQSAYRKLCRYYGSSQWMRDFMADEAGKLPADLKRGVLSEDAVYDLLTDNRELTVRLLKTITETVKNA
ncbi:MAG: DUF4298 domain-containing protein [Clostridia bacterium]|nr:DUF4298 domain-containing protein [Clostridia bacterium]